VCTYIIYITARDLPQDKKKNKEKKGGWQRRVEAETLHPDKNKININIKTNWGAARGETETLL
jgi:hypothetical protein